MRCPKCSAWNRESFPVCFRCGQPLVKGSQFSAAAPAVAPPKLAERMAEPPRRENAARPFGWTPPVPADEPITAPIIEEPVTAPIAEEPETVRLEIDEEPETVRLEIDEEPETVRLEIDDEPETVRTVAEPEQDMDATVRQPIVAEEEAAQLPIETVVQEKPKTGMGKLLSILGFGKKVSVQPQAQAIEEEAAPDPDAATTAPRRSRRSSGRPDTKRVPAVGDSAPQPQTDDDAPIDINFNPEETLKRIIGARLSAQQNDAEPELETARVAVVEGPSPELFPPHVPQAEGEPANPLENTGTIIAFAFDDDALPQAEDDVYEQADEEAQTASIEPEPETIASEPETIASEPEPAPFPEPELLPEPEIVAPPRRMLANSRYSMPEAEPDTAEPVLTEPVLMEAPRRQGRTFANNADSRQRAEFTSGTMPISPEPAPPQPPQQPRDRAGQYRAANAERMSRMYGVPGQERAAWGSPIETEAPSRSQPKTRSQTVEPAAEVPFSKETYRPGQFSRGASQPETTGRGNPTLTQKRTRAARAAVEKPKNLGTLGSQRRQKSAAVTVLAWVVVLGLLGYGGYRGYRFIADTIKARTPTSLPAAQLDPSLTGPKIEESVVDGKNAHVLLFTGQDGEIINISDPRLPKPFNITIMSGIAKIVIPDDWWIPETPDNEVESLVVTLNPKLYTADGKEKVMQPVTYAVHVPLATLEMVSPALDQIETYSASIQVQFRVETDAKVTVGDNDVSDLDDKNGLITYNVKVEPKGNNYINITAKQEGHRNNTYVLTIFREDMDIPIELYTSTAEVSKTSQVPIRGSTQAGAAITIETEHSDLEYDKELGSFRFNAKLTRYGPNEVIIRASMEGKEDSQIRHVVEYQPSLDEYSRGAWPLAPNYNNLVNNIERQIGQRYLCEGEIRTIEKADVPMLILFVSDKTEKELLVYFEYNGKEKWEPGKRMRVWADVIGEHEGIPLLAARFIYYQ